MLDNGQNTWLILNHPPGNLCTTELMNTRAHGNTLSVGLRYSSAEFSTVERLALHGSGKTALLCPTNLSDTFLRRSGFERTRTFERARLLSQLLVIDSILIAVHLARNARLSHMEQLTREPERRSSSLRELLAGDGEPLSSIFRVGV